MEPCDLFLQPHSWEVADLIHLWLQPEMGKARMLTTATGCRVKAFIREENHGDSLNPEEYYCLTYPRATEWGEARQGKA